MLHLVDNFLNSITMYKVVLYGLFILSAIAILFAFVNIISFEPLALILSLIALIFACAISNHLFSKLFGAPTNFESSYITALILFLVLLPSSTIIGLLNILILGVIAMASKYFLAVNRKHIFNPTAFALVLSTFTGLGNPAWWITTSSLVPFVIIIGFLVVRKLRRFSLLISFLVANIAFSIIVKIYMGHGLSSINFQTLLPLPILFFATIMLTEPLTTPPVRKYQVTYGSLIGTLISLPINFGAIFLTPEIALLIGNIFSYIVSSKQRFIMTFKRKNRLAENIYEFVFRPNQKPNFVPGQYLEWTLPHKKADIRGNRRFFTIASSPTENEIKIGVKFYPGASSFKRALDNLNPGTKISAGSLGGDFVLPKDPNTKLVFLAGGIGVTPFRSMLAYLIDKKESRDCVLFYILGNPEELSYRDILEKAEKIGIKVVPVATHNDNIPANWKGERGHLTLALINKYVPDYKERIYYISGSNAMVDAHKDILRKIGIRRNKIITDYFPGY